MIYTINIKQEFPPADVAVANALREIEVQKVAGNKIMKIVHGHGSHAKGGLIKQELHKALLIAKRNRLIKDYIKGENFTSKHPLYDKIVHIAPDIVIDNDLRSINMGITIILI